MSIARESTVENELTQVLRGRKVLKFILPNGEIKIPTNSNVIHNVRLFSTSDLQIYASFRFIDKTVSDVPQETRVLIDSE